MINDTYGNINKTIINKSFIINITNNTDT